jgi:membrane-associated phospholipid phosphatase
VKKTLQSVFGQGIFNTGWKNGILSILLAIGVYFTSRIYALLNHGPAVINLHTALDSAIPVVPIFVIPYISLQPYIYSTLVLFLLSRTKYFQSACLAMVTVWFISYGFYYFLQSEVIRPVLSRTDIFSKMVMNVYAVDNPYNDFPSLHSSLSTILTIHWVKIHKPLGIVLSIWTVLIVASTLLITQHYIPDMIFGLALAFGASWLYTKVIVKKSATD